MADAVAIGGPSWQQQSGPLVFAPFMANKDHAPADRQWMLHFRQQDQAAPIAPARPAGIEVEARAEGEGEQSQLARSHDPEGSPAEPRQATTA